MPVQFFRNCPCCGGSSSSSSSSSGSTACRCCTTHADGCCGCCCIKVPANPPYWTRDLYAFFTGSGPCPELGQSFCEWAAFSNVYSNLGGFGYQPEGSVVINGNANPGNLDYAGTFTYVPPDGFDWSTFCETGSPVTVTLITDVTGNPHPPSPTLELTPVSWSFTGPDPSYAGGGDRSCHCLFQCGPAQFCTGICVYQAVEGGDGHWSLQLITTDCGDPPVPGYLCDCDNVSAEGYPTPPAGGFTIGFQCLAHPI